MHHKNVVVIALALSLSTTACKKDESATGEAAKQSMGLYAKGYNILIKNPQGVIDDYFQNFPADVGPKVDGAMKPHLFGQMSGERDLKEVHESFDAAKAGAPASLSSVGPLSDKLISAADHVLAVYGDAYAYYDAERYKDDKLAKGQKLHTDMIAATKAFEGAMHDMGDGLSAIEDAQATSELEDRAGKKDYAYWWRAYNLGAKKLLAVAERGDAAAIGKAVAAFESTQRGFSAFVSDKGTGVAQAFTGYVSASGRFSAALERLGRAAKSAPAEIDAAVGDLVSAYNSLISISNSLAPLEGTPALE